jgi:hypothetical protein
MFFRELSRDGEKFFARRSPLEGLLSAMQVMCSSAYALLQILDKKPLPG